MRLSDASIAVAFTAYADLVRIIAFLLQWREAVLRAFPDASRFKHAAMERLKLWHAEHGSRDGVQLHRRAIEDIGESITLNDVNSVCERLANVPLPLPIRGDGHRRFDRERNTDHEEKVSPELSVAFLGFHVDGDPVSQIQFLTPYETHDLGLEVRISRWPVSATELRLSPVSIEAASSYDLPKFTLRRPFTDPPFICHERGRAIIKAAQAIRAQPFEFRYAAEFWPAESEQPVAVVGHRTLRIESVDVLRTPLTGYDLVDRRLLELRNKLRGYSPMPPVDLEAALRLAVPLAALAARALQDDLFPKSIPEAEFQVLVRDELRRQPSIGSQLEEHPRAGGGETDLSLFGIRLELKVEPSRLMALNDCQQYVEQAAAYAVGSGRPLALLCVLDASPKPQAPFSAESGLGLLVSNAGIPVMTILIQGGLATPSELSKPRRRARQKS